VKEFSHLKWGLFDEDVSINEKVEDRFQKGTGKNYGPTRCTDYKNIYLKIMISLSFIIDSFLYPFKIWSNKLIVAKKVKFRVPYRFAI